MTIILTLICVISVVLEIMFFKNRIGVLNETIRLTDEFIKNLQDAKLLDKMICENVSKNTHALTENQRLYDAMTKVYEDIKAQVEDYNASKEEMKVYLEQKFGPPMDAPPKKTNNDVN